METVRRGLERCWLGRMVVRAVLHRTDVCFTRGQPRPADLLQGDRIAALERRGKQLAVVGRSGRVLVVHLGMTGQVLGLGRDQRPQKENHIHAEWLLEDGCRVIFRDPRRFGGLWPLASRTDLEMRWAELGPDALTVTGDALRSRAGQSQRAIKAVLLDQRVVAGVGNIYADEALFRAGLSPRRLASRLTPQVWDQLAAAIRETLTVAVGARGSTLRDYVGASGEAGGAQLLHQVYGRAGLPCVRCGRKLTGIRLAQRATVYCRGCQS